MNDDRIFQQSRFWHWYAAHQSFNPDEEEALRLEALGVLVDSVSAGEILSLDGVDSPLSQRIKAHHQLPDFEMNSHWIGSAQTWTCPCCARSKFLIARVGRKNQILAKLVIHHDHMGEALSSAFHAAFEKAGTDTAQIEGQRLVERMGRAFAAYEEVLVCEDCNNADTEAKRLLSTPPSFSFSIGQIRQFIRYGDHRAHEVDASLAAKIWQAARPAYELRMKLIRAVAHAAATDTHWYEPHARRMDAIPVLGYRRRQMDDDAIQKWVSTESLVDALGPKKKPALRNLSRWRTTIPPAGRPLPPNFLAMLRSEESRARIWDLVPDDWSCPICRRSKHQSTCVGDRGKIGFYIRTNRGHGHWAGATEICNHCSSILMSLKLEISYRVGYTLKDSYSFVGPGELSRIIVARPHSPHVIRSAEAEALVDTIVQRLV